MLSPPILSPKDDQGRPELAATPPIGLWLDTSQMSAAETVAAAINIAYNSDLAVAVLLSQRLIGIKRWVK